MGPWVPQSGFVAFLVSSLVIGIRLLVLWSRTRQLPELLIACGILGIGPVGFVFTLVGTCLAARRFRRSPPCAWQPPCSRLRREPSRRPSSTGGCSAPMCLGCASVVGVAGGPLRRLLHLGGHLHGLHGPQRSWTSGFRPHSTLSTAILLWGAAESLRYYAMMRRRAKLGLADPLVTNRFLLWGLGIGAAGIGSAISVTAMVPSPVSTCWRSPGSPPATRSTALTAAVLMWVAFIPPGFYRRFVESRSQQPAV